MDAALYWKAYTLKSSQNVTDALEHHCGPAEAIRGQPLDERATRKALEENGDRARRLGQAVSPEGQNDDDLKLLALRGLMRSDPERAVPMIDQLLAGNSSVNVKENALFVLSQSQTPQAKAILANAARNSTNPDLQLRAVRYLGAMGGADNSQLLDDIYRTTTDASVEEADDSPGT